jgi:hypothetical protein
MTHRFPRVVAATLAASIALAVAPPAHAQVARPLPGHVPAGASDPVTPVYWRGSGAGVAAGIAAGLLLGGVLAGRPYYWGYGPPPPYDAPPVYVGPPVYDDEIAYCKRRFKSYDVRSGTYLGYDGYRHPCP